MSRFFLVILYLSMSGHIFADVRSNQVTIVSAFLSNINHIKTRNIEDYIKNGEFLLLADIPKVIFIESSIYDRYYKKNHSNGLYPKTSFRFIDRDSLWLWQYIEMIQCFNLKVNPYKDTLEYIFMMCNKTEWVSKAIDLDIFHTEQYIWVDFGLFHVFKDQKIFDYELIQLKRKSYDFVRIGGSWDLAVEPKKRNMDIYREVAWYFAGGVFGGDKESLQQFHKLVKEKCKEVIFEKKSIMWEVNIWYLVYLENKEIFSVYSCGHNSSILSNY